MSPSDTQHTYRIMLFGPQARLAGKSELSITLPGETATPSMMMESIAKQAQALAESLPASRLAVNHSYVGPDDSITPGDEIALIGMVSGG